MQDEFAPPAAPDTVYTVSAVWGYLRAVLEADPALSDLRVIGEVSGYRNPSSGHHYFALRDEDSVLRCVMFRGGAGAAFLGDGQQVICHGRISIYTARGDLQFYVDSVRPEGLGALQQAFEELKRRLEAEGLFDTARKRALPEFPQRIAVITSPTGAVIEDILHVLSRRYPLAEVIVVPTSVQGDRAAPEIVRALRALNVMEDVDVAVLARGGGSLEDLWPFNEEIVARAIFASPVPVISAIGHETDFTIADLVADVRAPTPSAAAEIVAPDRLELSRQVLGFEQAIADEMNRRLRDARALLELRRDRLIARAPDTRMPRRAVDDLLARARLAGRRIIEHRKTETAGVEATLRALGPQNILNRGYAIARLKGGPVLTQAADVSVGEEVQVTLARGALGTTVTGVQDGDDGHA